ncbi:hypothetical protein KSF73_06100 [Burkholderiaceae bacterium DAT-1]|nr:hypothetical protein [Burkholderiaceae bacterium DAT-1]
MKTRFTVLAVLMSAGVLACAGDNMPPPPGDHDQPPHHHARREPPPEAFTACEGKQAGDKVTVKTPRGDTLQASCRKHGDSKLFAMPDRPPREGGRPDGPPPKQD